MIILCMVVLNLHFSDKIATGAFDKTVKLWSAETGKCYHTYRGHTGEVVSPCQSLKYVVA